MGTKASINSATLNRTVNSVFLFDLERVNTEAHYNSERKETLRKMGTLASQLEMKPAPEDNRVMLLRALEDPHVKPEDLMRYARLVDGYSEIFSAKAGNWEGFTLGAHTETVLRNFDENFADTLPVELLAPIRLMLLGHDLGKPQAVADHAKHREKEYNLRQATDFFSKLDVPDNMANLLLSVIGNGAELVYKSDIAGNSVAYHNLRLHAVRSLQQFNSGNSVATADQVDGYIELCRMLLTCDGGAYTSMATTRRPEQRGGRYRNAPSFNRSFAEPHGLGKRGIKLAGALDNRAPADLTPKVDPNQSKLRISHRGVARGAPKFTTG